MRKENVFSINLYFMFQADIFKSDFLAERRAREELNQKKEELQEKLSQTLTELNLLKQEKMQQRHVDNYGSRQHMAPPGIRFYVICQQHNHTL